MSNGWKQGTIEIPDKDGGYKTAMYWGKTFDEPSEDYGINGGRISKLSIKMGGEWVAYYDGGWNVIPDENNDATQVAYYILLDSYN